VVSLRSLICSYIRVASIMCYSRNSIALGIEVDIDIDVLRCVETIKHSMLLYSRNAPSV
jgi:hypothetical protein